MVQHIRNILRIILSKMLQHIRNVWQISWKIFYNVSRKSPKDTRKNLTTYQKHVLEKPLQRFKKVLQVAWSRCYNVSRTSFKLLDEDVTTCQERLATYLEKLLPCIKNVLTGLWWRCHNLSGTCCKLLDENDAMYQECLLSCKYFAKIRYNVSGGSSKNTCQNITTYQKGVLEQTVATYQERLASSLQTILQRITNVLQTI